jgi:hypothetical protein
LGEAGGDAVTRSWRGETETLVQAAKEGILAKVADPVGSPGRGSRWNGSKRRESGSGCLRGVTVVATGRGGATDGCGGVGSAVGQPPLRGAWRDAGAVGGGQ